MSTDRERYARLYAIFDAARQLQGPALDAHLDAQCAGDDDLRAGVERLLAAAAREKSTADGFEAHIAASRKALEQLASAQPRDAWLPERIAGYRVVRRLGEGGMGVVYEAMQESPKRRVAIKLLHPLRATEERLHRLRHEAEVLGRLQHPGIAQVHEAGTYDLGQGAQPFFAMELVEGIDVRAYCQRQQLDLRGRLELVARVCDAVDHAHQKKVVHRDLKPDNILVDAHGQPKVLDFGIARAADDSTLVSSQVTQDGQLLGTLAYMAPEQLRGDHGAITQRTDVYGLGVVAFELAAGRLPFDVAGLGLATALRMLQEQDPPSLGTLDRSLRGDVEAIIGRAIEKDPARRYPSAAALAADLRRYLHDEPVHARPPSRVYKMRKLVRKNRGLFTAIAVVIASLVAGLGWALVEKQRASLRSTQLAAQAYRANLVVAAGAIVDGRMATARQFLGETPPSLRDWECRYLQAQLDQSVRHFEPSGAPAMDLAVAADGRTFVTAAQDGTLLCRDTFTGDVLATIKAPGVPYHCAMSSDGRQLFALGADADVVPAAADTKDRVWVASWSLPDGRPLDRFLLDPSFRVANTIPWNLVVPPAVRDGFDSSISVGLGTFAFDVDRRRLALGTRPNTISVFDLNSHMLVASASSRALAPCSFSPSGRYLVVVDRPGSLNSTNKISILDATTLETRGRLAGYHDPINYLAISPDETRIATLTPDGTLLTWDMAAALASQEIGGPLHIAVTHQGGGLQVCYSDDGARLITAGSTRSIQVWDATSNTPLVRLPSQEEEVVRVGTVPGTDEVATISGRGRVRFWTTGDRNPTILRGHQSFVYAVDVDRELGLIVTGAWDGYEGKSGALRLWDLESGDPVAAWGDPPSAVRHAMFLPGREAVLASSGWFPPAPPAPAAAGRSRVTYVDLRTGSSRLLGEVGAPAALLPSRAQGKAWMLFADDTGAHMRELDLDSIDASPLRDAPRWGLAGAQLAVTDDERLVAISAQDQDVDTIYRSQHLQVCRADDLSVVHELAGHDDAITSLDFDPAGRRLLSASEDATVRVWDVRSGRLLAELIGHDDGVLCARFNPTGTRIATGGRDGTLRIWNGETYQQLVALSGHTGYVYHLAWQDDGERILTASGDHTVRIWETQPVRDRSRAQRERRAIVEKLTPRIDAWVAQHRDPALGGLLAGAPDLTPRERQVARQILLGRVLRDGTLKYKAIDSVRKSHRVAGIRYGASAPPGHRPRPAGTTWGAGADRRSTSSRGEPRVAEGRAA